MSRKFQVKAIPSTWLEHNGRRLDCGPYMSGAIEARELLKKHETERLSRLTSGFDGGIFNGPRFPRMYVNDEQHGIPFLGSTDILHGDLSHMTLLAKRQVAAMPSLKLEEGWTLITCSGTIGRMSYARADMAGMAGSQHFMRVAPDRTKILPGYLFSFLSSRFGVPIVISGTYGAIIQHIEPGHLVDLPVPRLGTVENKAHDLIQSSANLLTFFQTNLRKASKLLFSSVGLADISSGEWHAWGSDLGFIGTVETTSLRALNYNPRLERLINRMKSSHWKTLSDLCIPGTLKRGGRYTRIDAEPEFSYHMIGQREIFWLRPEGRWIAKSCVDDEVMVAPGTILIAGAGTFGESELYCRSEFIWGKAVERAYSELFYRVVADERKMPRGCLFAFMRSETAFRMLRSISFGSKLQYPLLPLLYELPVPYPCLEIQNEIHKLVVDAFDAKDRALELGVFVRICG